MPACAATSRLGHIAPPPLAESEIRLWARILRMSDARTLDAPLIEDALASSSGALRAAAALAVGQTHGAPLAPRLRALLADRDSEVAANAAFALGLLRDSAAVPALARGLALQAPVSVAAAWALGEIGGPARAAIVSALRPGGSGPASTAAIPSLLVAAGRLRPLPTEAVLPWLLPRSGDAETVRAAAYTIARVRVPAGARALLSHFTSGDTETRQHVARGLASSATGDSLADTALVALAELARDPHPHVRVNALRSLGGYGPRARRALTAATADRDGNVRVAAAQSLAGVLPARRGDWHAAWDADTAFMYRRSLIASAVTGGVILEAIDEDNPDNWQRHADWRYRAASAEAASGASQIERVVEVSLPMTRDRDGRVRAAAYAVLAPWVDSSGGAQHPWRRAFFLPALRDPDVVVRATALGALLGRARADEVPLVLASYALAWADSTNDARVAAARYLASAWRLDSAAFGDSLRGVVGALPVPGDPLVVAEGKGSSLLVGWRPDSAPPHPTEWYEGVVRTYVVPSLTGAPVGAQVVTERGAISLALSGVEAPLTVRNFVALARSGYYRGTRFHRVVPNFVAQDGDPRGDGNGGPGYSIRDELNRRAYDRGSVGMALSGPDTGGSQYFLTLSRQPHLDGRYTLFARITAGADVMDRLVQGDSIVDVRVP